MGKSAISKHQQLLLELTSLPTAAGCEQNVVQYIERFFARRKQANVKKDRYGNLHVSAKHGPRTRNPIVVTAHLDHPAFVVVEQRSRKEVIAEFRGGVADEYFSGTKVQLHLDDGGVAMGKVVEILKMPKSYPYKKVLIEMSRGVESMPGQMMTWWLPKSRIVGSKLRAPVCDDLAAVAAALGAYDVLLRKRQLKHDVRLLFTRAEEVGFLGAIAAAKHQLVPAKARLITLENSKSFEHDSPIGGGPILRVGDRISTFNHELNQQIDQVAIDLAKRKKGFIYQRKLMPGGACEATAFQSYGYQATCLCLPLGNYHNMNEQTGRIDREEISVNDYENLIAWLVAVGERLDEVKSGDLKGRLNKLLAERGRVLGV